MLVNAGNFRWNLVTMLTKTSKVWFKAYYAQVVTVDNEGECLTCV